MKDKDIDYLKNACAYSDYVSHPVDGASRLFEFTTPQQLHGIFINYNLPDVAGSGDTFSRALKIMQWITDHSEYSGGSYLCPTTSDKIIAHAFEKGTDGAINCANKSILLADALTHIEIFAMPVAVMGWILDPDSPIFENASSHVVVHVFLPECNKWVMLDPSFNTYVVDRNFAPLNIIEVATALRDGHQMFTYDIGEETLAFKGLACLLYSLPHIQIWRGNDYVHRVGRFTWDTAYLLESKKALYQVQYLLDNNFFSESIRPHMESYMNLTRITTSDFLTPPC